MSNILDQTEQETIISRALSYLLKTEALPFVDRIILFGSAARHEMTNESDVDFCVVVHNESDIKTVRKLIRHFKRDSGDYVSYDILVFDENSLLRMARIGGVCREIQREGRTLYNRTGKVA